MRSPGKNGVPLQKLPKSCFLASNPATGVRLTRGQTTPLSVADSQHTLPSPLRCDSNKKDPSADSQRARARAIQRKSNFSNPNLGN